MMYFDITEPRRTKFDSAIDRVLSLMVRRMGAHIELEIIDRELIPSAWSDVGDASSIDIPNNDLRVIQCAVIGYSAL
jgi:hypothetical protein